MSIHSVRLCFDKVDFKNFIEGMITITEKQYEYISLACPTDPGS